MFGRLLPRIGVLLSSRVAVVEFGVFSLSSCDLEGGRDGGRFVAEELLLPCGTYLFLSRFKRFLCSSTTSSNSL